MTAILNSATGTDETPSLGRAAFPDRTFEAIVFDWDGTAVPDRAADAADVRRLVEELCSRGVDVAVVSGTHVGNVDGQLLARPSGPGRLHLCLNRGSEVFLVSLDGPQLVWRRESTPKEEHELDEAADIVVRRLAAKGLEARVVSSRLNRRKIDVIPLPEWDDPPKARIDDLLAAVTNRLATVGLGLEDVVALAEDAARDAGLSDPRVTSDVKHVEVGLTDKSDSVRWLLDDYRSRGVGSGLVLLGGDEFGDIGGVEGSDSLMLVPEVNRATVVSVGVEPEGPPPGVVHLGGGPVTFVQLLADQLRRRSDGRVPDIDADPAWTLSFHTDYGARRRVDETLLTIGDGRFGTRGALEEDGPGTEPLVLAGGVYRRGATGLPELAVGPWWAGLALRRIPGGDRRLLDMRSGVLLREERTPGGLRTMRFASLARPGVMAMRAEGGEELSPGPALQLLGDQEGRLERRADGSWSAKVTADLGGGIAAQARTTTRWTGSRKTLERLVAYRADAARHPRVSDAGHLMSEAEALGFDRLLTEHRAAWASRWADADIGIEGDPESQVAVRFALFHLMASVPAGVDEAAVGARGVSGPAYAGHVFWDSDVFVLPFLAASHPESARAMLEYRLRRLDEARAIAASQGCEGARFAWESAHDGSEVTPNSYRTRSGKLMPIRTGRSEDHIAADVAWAAAEYAAWTGDEDFVAGPGAPLFVETARYWSTRARWGDDGRAHIYRAIGPDEYHGVVDDNAYTNVMARWNLRAGADVLEHIADDPERHAEAVAWRLLAADLADGYDPSTRRYEQFAGYNRLTPTLITDVASPPVAVDILLGPERVAASQLIKQPDVLMLHHLVPSELAPGSLAPNVEWYLPRTAHGSSLSPAICAAVLARNGEPDRALELFQVAAHLDLDDLTGTTAAGLHMATLGGLWQAVVYGFAGVRATADALEIDPRLPTRWTSLSVRVRWHGHPVQIIIRHDRVEVRCHAATPVRVCGGETSTVDGPGRSWTLMTSAPLQEVLR